MKVFVTAVLAIAWTAVAHAEFRGGDLAAGRSAFAAACASCHQVGPKARPALGPQLNGILGRRVGSDPGYTYSRAMAEARFDWSEQKLAAFLRKPARVVPGTKMRFFGLGLSDQRLADLFAYLRSVPPPAASPQ